METFVIFANDKTHVMNQVLPLLEDANAAKWVLVGCPPRVTRHAGKWLTQRALKRFKDEWTETNLRDVAEVLKKRGDNVVTRVADTSLLQMTKTLKAEFGPVRIIDARLQRQMQTLPAVTESQVPEASTWVVPVGAIAFGAAVSLAAD
jgi:hypothetical protein